MHRVQEVANRERAALALAARAALDTQRFLRQRKWALGVVLGGSVPLQLLLVWAPFLLLLLVSLRLDRVGPLTRALRACGAGLWVCVQLGCGCVWSWAVGVCGAGLWVCVELGCGCVELGCGCVCSWAVGVCGAGLWVCVQLGCGCVCSWAVGVCGAGLWVCMELGWPLSARP